MVNLIIKRITSLCHLQNCYNCDLNHVDFFFKNSRTKDFDLKKLHFGFSVAIFFIEDHMLFLIYFNIKTAYQKTDQKIFFKNFFRENTWAYKDSCAYMGFSGPLLSKLLFLTVIDSPVAHSYFKQSLNLLPADEFLGQGFELFQNTITFV